MFVGKAKSLPKTGAPESSSLLRKLVTYGRQKFNNIGPRSWCHRGAAAGIHKISSDNLTVLNRPNFDHKKVGK